MVRPFAAARRCAVLAAWAMNSLYAGAFAEERPLTEEVNFRLSAEEQNEYIDSLAQTAQLQQVEKDDLALLIQNIESLRQRYSAAAPAEQAVLVGQLRNKVEDVIARLGAHERDYRSLADRLAALYARLSSRGSGGRGAGGSETVRENGAAKIARLLEKYCPETGSDAQVCIRRASRLKVEAGGTIASGARGLALSGASLERSWRSALGQADRFQTYVEQYQRMSDQIEQETLRRIHELLRQQAPINPGSSDFYLLRREPQL